MNGKRRDSFSGEETDRHDKLEALRLFDQALKKLKIEAPELARLKKSDSRKKAIAWVIRKNTNVRNEWIARRIEMGCTSNMSQYVREVEEANEGVLYGLKKILK